MFYIITKPQKDLLFSILLFIGDFSTRYLTYEYYVNARRYTRYITPRKNIDYRYYHLNSCKEWKFWVIYSKENTDKSLIDLTTRIDGVENPDFPKSLKNFE